MKGNGQRQREIEALGALVDRFGADRTRWPAPDRLRFAALLKDSAEARRVLAEAEAFDRLLDTAPLVDAGRRAALADRIVARALAEGGSDAAASRTTMTPAAAQPRVTDLERARAARAATAAASRRPRLGVSSPWPAAALLAASLVLGIFAGSSGLLPAANFGLTAGAADSDYYGRAFALGPEVGTAADEDTL